MPEEPKREIPITVSKCEFEFLKFTRSSGFTEFKLTVMNGEPVKAHVPIKSIRFDIVENEALDKTIISK